MLIYIYTGVKKTYNYIYQKLTELTEEEIEYNKYIQN